MIAYDDPPDNSPEYDGFWRDPRSCFSGVCFTFLEDWGLAVHPPLTIVWNGSMEPRRHGFHPECIRRYVKQGYPNCPTCEEPLAAS